MGPNLRVHLFGEMMVELDGSHVRHFPTVKSRALLAYLAMDPNQPHSRQLLADYFWPDMVTSDSLRNLRLALHRLKTALQTATPAQTHSQTQMKLFLTSWADIGLHPDLAVWTDALEFEILMDMTSRHPHEALSSCPACAQQLTTAVGLYRGEFLQGLDLETSITFEEWLVVQRERFHRQAITAYYNLAEYHYRQAQTLVAGAGRLVAYEDALKHARAVLKLEPWNEPAHRLIIRVLAGTDRPQDAIAQYRTCCRILSEELNSEPAAETRLIYQQLTNPAASPPPPPVPHPGNIRPALTPFFGRQAQVDKLSRLIFSYRWVTLVGEGGIGKTRLAQHVAELVHERFPDGVWWCSLEAFPEALSSRLEGFQILSQALLNQLPFLSGDSQIHPAELMTQVGGAKMLLVLDSFENYSTCADCFLDMLNRVPNLRIVLTTRQMLYFQAGYMMRLEGLPIPDEEDAPGNQDDAAIQLFIETAERAGGVIPLADDSLSRIVQICRKLEGNPLAIELAAPWTTRYSLSEINARLDQDPAALAALANDLPERHSSMRAVFGSSWRLLSQSEQQILQSCSELPAEFSFSDLAAILPATKQQLDDLADKCLLSRSVADHYRMHELLRRLIKEQILADLLNVDSDAIRGR